MIIGEAQQPTPRPPPDNRMESDALTDTPPAPFELEVLSEMSEADYLKWNHFETKQTLRARAPRWLLTVIALACFISWQTAAIGVVLSLAAMVVWTSGRWMAMGNRLSYQKSEYLHGPLIYGVSSRGLWFRGGMLRAESTWEGLGTWGERDGFFWLAGHGMPQLIFPISNLRRAGIYGRIRELAAQHAVEYDSPAARAGHRTERAAAT